MASSANSCSILRKGQKFKCGECGITFEVVAECNKGCSEDCNITLNCCGKDMDLIER